MKNVKPISSLRVITVANGELFLDGVSAGLPTIEDLKSKQDKILLITLTEQSGILPEELLSLLNDANRLVYNNNIYYLSMKENNVQKYFAKAENVLINEIDVDLSTGEYLMKVSINPVLQSHIEDTTIHVTQSEKNYWNNKVSATVEALEDDNNNLILSNH